ncbi:MAG: ABC transporter permease, partial [Bryobacteraceae bacterium]
MFTLWQDIRYAARMLRQNRGFTAVAVTAIALGIGATTTIFSVVDTVLLQPLPYPEPDRLLWVAMNFPAFKVEILAGPDFLEWRDRNRVFENMAAYDNAQLTLTGAGDAMRIRCAAVTHDFFATFRVNPKLGRGFLPGEDLPHGPEAIVLT